MHLLGMFICNVLSKSLAILEINSVVTVRLGGLQTQETADFRDADLYKLLYETVFCKLTELR